MPANIPGSTSSINLDNASLRVLQLLRPSMPSPVMFIVLRTELHESHVVRDRLTGMAASETGDAQLQVGHCQGANPPSRMLPRTCHGSKSQAAIIRQLRAQLASSDDSLATAIVARTTTDERSQSFRYVNHNDEERAYRSRSNHQLLQMEKQCALT